MQKTMLIGHKSVWLASGALNLLLHLFTGFSDVSLHGFASPRMSVMQKPMAGFLEELFSPWPSFDGSFRHEKANIW